MSDQSVSRTVGGKRRLVAVGMGIVMVVAGCSSSRGSAPKPSTDALCSTYAAEVEKFAGAFGKSPLGDLIALLSAPNDLAVAFDKMARVAPDEIRSDVEALRDTFREQAKSSPTLNAGALLEGLLRGAGASGSFTRVDDWLTGNCQDELSRLEANRPASSTTTTMQPQGQQIFDQDVDCSEGQLFVDHGAAASVSVAFTEIRGIATIKVAARDKNDQVVGNATIKGPDIDGTGGSGRFDFAVPAGGFSLRFGDGENILTGCKAHLTIHAMSTTGDSSPAPTTPSDGSLITTVDVGEQSTCRVEAGTMIVREDDGNNRLNRVRFFSQQGERVASFAPADLSTPEDYRGALADVTDRPVIVAHLQNETPADGIIPGARTSKVVLYDPVARREVWAVDGFFGQDASKARTQPALPVLIAKQSVVVFQDGATPRLLSLSLQDGRVIWSAPANPAVPYQVPVDGSFIYIRNNDNTVDFRNPETGAFIAQFPGGFNGALRTIGPGLFMNVENQGALVFDLAGTRRSYSLGQGALVDDWRIIVQYGENGEGLRAIDTTTGKTMWTVPKEQLERVGFALGKVTDQVVFGSTSDGNNSKNVVMLSMKDGKQLKVFTGQPDIVLGVSSGTGYFTCDTPPRVFHATTPPVALVDGGFVR